MPILSNYLEDMDKLKEKIQDESKAILEAIDLNHLLSCVAVCNSSADAGASDGLPSANNDTN